MLPQQGQGELTGRVLAGEQPLSAVRVAVATRSSADGSVEIRYGMTAEDGRYRVSSLPPGIYLVSVQSTSTGQGARIRPGEVTTLDLQVAGPSSAAD